MKLGIKIIGLLILVAIGYFLYQSGLGAIPFLAASVVLFYLGCRLIPDTDPNQAEGQPPE